MEKDSLWVMVLKTRYGDQVTSSPTLGEAVSNRFSSIWWKDLCYIGSCGFGVGDWLVDGIRKKIGYGNTVLFWHDNWFGNLPLKEVFPRLFAISAMQNEKVSNFGKWENNVWIWDFKWRINFFVWEEELLLEFHNTFLAISLVQRDAS